MRLPADVTRCHGAGVLRCPDRDQCARWVDWDEADERTSCSPFAMTRTANGCKYMIPTEGSDE